jgi:hypothetical protein
MLGRNTKLRGKKKAVRRYSEPVKGLVEFPQASGVL